LYARQRSQAERREKKRSSEGRAVLAGAGVLGLEGMISISILVLMAMAMVLEASATFR